MARIPSDPNYYIPATFPRATTGTDIFVKEDVQALAAAVPTHTHGTGKGLPVEATAIPNGSITSVMIADGTIAAADLAADAVTTAKIADGAVTNAKLASDTARANLLTNGGFEIWQRGNGPFIGGGVGPDRWVLGQAGTDTMSVSKDTTNMDSASGSKACAAMTFGLGSGAGGTYLINQIGNDVSQVANRVLSLSMRVKTSTANAVRASLYTGSAFVNSAYHSGSGAYETLTVTATMGSGAQAGNSGANFVASCTAHIDNAMLVVGSVPADYAPLHPADDLARCLRYYEIIGETAHSWQFAGYGTAAMAMQWGMSYKARKPVAPTVTKNGTWLAGNCSQPSIASSGVDMVSMQITVTAAGAAGVDNSSAGQNVSIEANP